MNKQGANGIEWTQYTWNPVAGCKHACRWEMPDGSTTQCYAETVAEGIARGAYPDGFQAHYWKPNKLNEPLKVTEPSRIFLDSMSDLMGHWVPDEQIRAVFDVVRRADWHHFQLLTKNAPRLLKFKDELPSNLWVGVSMPPTFMFGNRLRDSQQNAMFAKSLDVLAELEDKVLVRYLEAPEVCPLCGNEKLIGSTFGEYDQHVGAECKECGWGGIIA
jgi:protein gp37